MNEHFKSIILHSTGAKALVEKETIQHLWSGYGKIMRIGLIGSDTDHVIIKHVQLPELRNHSRGWNTDIGHQRKVRSYQVEMAWYANYAMNSKARLPKCLALESKENEVMMVLEDLDEAGFSLRKSTVTWEEISLCLGWLARFHASFLGVAPKGLWEVGTYWHLETRPEELMALDDQRLKSAAEKIDKKLNNCKYKTLVHGDAKLANFCFGQEQGVSGLDFQYVGGGCGMKDVAYFIGSCLDERECGRLESKILDTYFDYLQQALPSRNMELETEWRSLYHVAWADFHRFIKGWSPGHWKINSYSERVTREVINNL